VHPGKLHNLPRLSVFVECKADPRVYDLAISISMSAEDQPAIFCSFVVVEKHSCLGPVHFGEFLAFYDYSGQALMVGDYHSQSSVRLDNIDSVDFDIIKALVALGRRACQQQDHQYCAQKSRVPNQNLVDNSLHITLNTKRDGFVSTPCDSF